MKPMKTSEVWIRIMLMTEIMVQSAEQTFGLFCTFLFAKLQDILLKQAFFTGRIRTVVNDNVLIINNNKSEEIDKNRQRIN